jgi:hypothetical protein
MDMWECPKTHCKMFKDRRAAFCASRREATREGDTCYECTLKAEGEVGTYKNKVCVDCKTSKQVKDERCYKCFKKKHGCAPYPSPEDDKKQKKTKLGLTSTSSTPSIASSTNEVKPSGKMKKQAGRQAEGINTKERAVRQDWACFLSRGDKLHALSVSARTPNQACPPRAPHSGHAAGAPAGPGV